MLRNKKNLIDKNLHKLNKLIAENKTSWESIDELAIEINVNNSSLKRYRKKLLELNFNFNTRKDTLYKNRSKFIKLLHQNKNEWESVKALEKETGSSKGKLHKHRDELESMGFVFKDPFKNSLMVNFAKLYKLLKENKNTWETAKELSDEVCPNSNLHKYRKELIEMGFVFTKSPVSILEKHSNILLELLNAGANKWPSPYALEKKVADGSNIRKKRIELENMGFEFENSVYIGKTDEG